MNVWDSSIRTLPGGPPESRIFGGPESRIFLRDLGFSGLQASGISDFAGGPVRYLGFRLNLRFPGSRIFGNPDNHRRHPRDVASGISDFAGGPVRYLGFRLNLGFPGSRIFGNPDNHRRHPRDVAASMEECASGLHGIPLYLSWKNERKLLKIPYVQIPKSQIIKDFFFHFSNVHTPVQIGGCGHGSRA